MAESVFVNTLAIQLVRRTVNLDEFSGALGTVRFTLLRRIALMKDIDSKLAVDIAIRWNHLFSRFRSNTCLFTKVLETVSFQHF